MIGLLLYVLLFGVMCVPGLPIGLALFGRRHVAGWISGCLLGYAVIAVVLWALVQARIASGAAFWIVLGLANAAGVATMRARWHAAPWILLPVWRTRDTTALVAVLLLVPALQWRPFLRIGEQDADGAARYRAYFTADFLWHVALTAELTKHSSPPRNPYLARRPLHYYWAYFVPPAFVAKYAPVLPDIQSHLLANAFCAGLLFIGSIFMLAWCVVPRAGPVAAAVICGVVAASAEGAYAAWDYWSRGRPLSDVRELNIDAITAWWFQTLTIDSLPRSLWYTPQHAMACALSLIALVIATALQHRMYPVAVMLIAGLALGLAVIFSPFLGGSFALIYGLSMTWAAVRERQPLWLGRAALAALPVFLALAWCGAAGTFEGSRGAVALGLSRTAAASPIALLGLAIGPVLGLAVLGLLLRAWQRWSVAAVSIGVTTGLFMLFFVTLTLEPVWIGWRAGQIILVTLPGLLAATFAQLWDTGRRRIAIVVTALVLVAGLPTTIIDAYNAQDVSNTAEAAGFKWTVVVPPDTRLVLNWIRDNTPPDAIVQMSIGPRRRETWTHVPTFAERRMAVGRPISLLNSPEYDLSESVDALYRAPDPAQAATAARVLRIDYLFVDAVDHATLDAAALAKFGDPRFFERAFASGNAAVYAVK